ncbi:MAG TPA: hypothetical protein VJ873_09230 [bacterium]|nr:hypothetical protein [bacterium]
MKTCHPSKLAVLTDNPAAREIILRILGNLDSPVWELPNGQGILRLRETAYAGHSPFDLIGRELEGFDLILWLRDPPFLMPSPLLLQRLARCLAGGTCGSTDGKEGIGHAPYPKQ